MPGEDGPPWPEETGVWKAYEMHCHCGSIRWTMTISPPLLEEDAEGKGVYVAAECLCSHCERNGIISVHPKVANVQFTRGLDDRVEYLSSTKQLPHWFCKHCGSQLGCDASGVAKFMGGEPRYSINVRMLKDIPVEKLRKKTLTRFRDMGPKYEV